jgi:pimeloyl-ACP methyl ester carboxylesterase
MKSDGVIVDDAGLEYADRGRGEPLFPQEVEVRLAYDDAGTGEPAAVLVHGWGFGNPSALVPQFDNLAKGHRVLKLELPGHGRSDRPPPGFGWQDCAAAIVATLDAAGVDRAVVCGHSLGGRLAVEIAAAYPSRIAGIALLDPVILFPEPVRMQALTGLVPALGTENWLTALEAYFSRLFSPYDPPELKARVLAELGQVRPEMAALIMQEGMATDGSDALARVRCPLLMVTAAQSPVDFERFRDLQPAALVGRVVGSGHWLTLAVPDQVNAMLDRFLEIMALRGTSAPQHATAATS